MGYGACLWLQELIALDAKFYPARVTWQIALPPEVEPRPILFPASLFNHSRLPPTTNF